MGVSTNIHSSLETGFFFHQGSTVVDYVLGKTITKVQNMELAPRSEQEARAVQLTG